MPRGTSLLLRLAAAVTQAKPQIPEAGRVLWRIFVELSATRTYHMAGPNPVGFAEIEAYARLHRWPLAPHHVAILRAMDDAWLKHAYAKIGKGKGQNLPTGSDQPISAGAFDAVFG